MAMRIKELPVGARPREKALRDGFSSLNEKELLAILIGKGVAGDNALEIASSLYEGAGTLKRLFSDGYLPQSHIRGVSHIKLLELGAVGELYRRLTLESFYSLPKPKSREIYEAFSSFLGENKRESLILLCYDRRGHFLSQRKLYKGTSSCLVYDFEEILEEVGKAKSHHFYLLHNHPSGLPLPSKSEVRDTMGLLEASGKRGIKLVDHEIISRDSFFSFADHGLLPRHR